MSKKLFALPKIIVIVGPTASGKTDLAIKLVQYFNNNIIARRQLTSCDDVKVKIQGVEILSADSRQIYKGMDIGTAKPTKAETKLIPYYLIDIKNPNQSYTVAEYKKDAIASIKKILKKGKLPIIVGGTGLYVKAVVDNLEIPEVKPNASLRKKLDKELESKGLNYLYKKLIELDPEATYIIDRNNPRRVIRALEITLSTNKPFSVQRKMGKKLFNALKIGINLPREELKERIYKRVDKMIRLGLINELKKLIKKYPASSPVFDAIGYRETISYLHGKILLNETVELIKKNTWHYAKRQITWFKKDKEIKWVKTEGEAFRLLREFI